MRLLVNPPTLRALVKASQMNLFGGETRLPPEGNHHKVKAHVRQTEHGAVHVPEHQRRNRGRQGLPLSHRSPLHGPHPAQVHLGRVGLDKPSRPEYREEAGAESPAPTREDDMTEAPKPAAISTRRLEPGLYDVSYGGDVIGQVVNLSEQSGYPHWQFNPEDPEKMTEFAWNTKREVLQALRESLDRLHKPAPAQPPPPEGKPTLAIRDAGRKWLHTITFSDGTKVESRRTKPMPFAVVGQWTEAGKASLVAYQEKELRDFTDRIDEDGRYGSWTVEDTREAVRRKEGSVAKAKAMDVGSFYMFSAHGTARAAANGVKTAQHPRRMRHMAGNVWSIIEAQPGPWSE